MPKRKNKDSDEYILRKIKKLERRIHKRSRKLSDISSENSDMELSLHEDKQPEVSEDVPEITENIDDTMNIVQSSPVELDLPITNTISDIPSTSEGLTETSIVLDSNIMDLLGETPSKTKKYSSPIQTELAVRWEHIATTGLSKEIKKDIFGKYFLPENCLKIGAPQLNPVKKDKAIEIKQNQQAIAITCISQALTTMFANQSKETDVIKLLLDAVRLLCDYQYVESMSRRSFVASTIKKEIKDQLYATEIDSFLFGEKLPDTLKAAKAIHKSGAEMKNFSQAKAAILSQRNQSRSLNVKPPLPLARQTGAGRRSAQQPRKYQTPALPPPPTRPHQSQLPTQPQHSRGRTQTRR